MPPLCCCSSSSPMFTGRMVSAWAKAGCIVVGDDNTIASVVTIAARGIALLRIVFLPLLSVQILLLLLFFFLFMFILLFTSVHMLGVEPKTIIFWIVVIEVKYRISLS